MLAIRSKAVQGGASAKALAQFSLLCSDRESAYGQQPVENSIRSIAIDKKNWFFTSSEPAGQRAAANQSLWGTAKLNGLDPATWRKEALDKQPSWSNSRIDELLPLAAEQINLLNL